MDGKESRVICYYRADHDGMNMLKLVKGGLYVNLIILCYFYDTTAEKIWNECREYWF